jgi:5'(3')-deoxyribonucleotidase
MHYTKHKWSIDVDVLIDDSPEKLEQFADRSVNHGKAICYKQTWNTKCHNKYISIDRLSDITTRLFG